MEQNGTLAEDNPVERVSILPEQISTLVEEYSEDEGIWPVIWDFAGQAVYRAIHPIFMSPEAIYLLVFDLTKALSRSNPAESLVKLDGHEEENVASPDSEDTNLDHIIRWMNLVYSVKHSAENVVSPYETSLTKGHPSPKSVIFVGTKADKVKGESVNKMSRLVKKICRNCPRILLKYITKDRFVVDNTQAGTSSNEEGQQITDLRKKIIEIADEMPHTKEVIPLQWLSVEKEIQEKVRNNIPHMLKIEFRREIFEKRCTLTKEDGNEDDDLEELLHFLHARGTIIYHVLPEDPDGLVVLDPKWLIGAICEIITAKPNWTYPPDFQCHYDNLKDKGILSNELLDLACRNLKIGDIKDSLIFIMKKFNLIFEWKSEDSNLFYLVPCMLSQSRVDRWR